MLKHLQQKWGVGPVRLLLILCTFALGGSLTGWLGRQCMQVFGIDSAFVYVPVYVLLITLLWPLTVLLVSVPLGQFSFFKTYLVRLFRRLSRRKTTPS